MTYATRQDLTDRFGAEEIAQREDGLSTGAVDRALADADAEIDSYVSAKYAVPLSPVPSRIVKVACSIARYHLLGDAVTEVARNDYTDARAWLRDIQAGKALVTGATALAGSAPAAAVEMVSSPTVWSRTARP